MTFDLRTTADSPSTAAYQRIVTFEGADQSSAVPLLVTPSVRGRVSVLYKPTGTLQLAETQADVVASDSSGSVVWVLPTFSQLGYTRTAGTTPELSFRVQRQGLGPLFVTPSSYLGSVASSAAMVALTPVLVGDWCQRSDDSNAPYQCVALPSSTAGNWVKQTGANAPTSAGIVVHWNNHDPQFLPQFHEPVMLMTCGAGSDEWVAF